MKHVYMEYVWEVMLRHVWNVGVNERIAHISQEGHEGDGEHGHHWHRPALVVWNKRLRHWDCMLSDTQLGIPAVIRELQSLLVFIHFLSVFVAYLLSE